MGVSGGSLPIIWIQQPDLRPDIPHKFHCVADNVLNDCEESVSFCCSTSSAAGTRAAVRRPGQAGVTLPAYGYCVGMVTHRQIVSQLCLRVAVCCVQSFLCFLLKVVNLACWATLHHSNSTARVGKGGCDQC